MAIYILRLIYILVYIIVYFIEEIMKKGQFFSIDVFVAIAIIAVGLFVLYTSKSIQPSTAQTSALSRI